MAVILNKADCPLVAVDGYFEAGKIRRLSRHRILVLGYILPENVKLLDLKRCSFVVQDIAGLEAFARLHKKVKIHLELNTGMNRLGLAPHELQRYLDVLKLFPKLELEGVMTHLADADNESDNDFTAKQVTQFDALVEQIIARGFHPRFIHIAQTAGSTKVSSQHANAMRLGIGLYGINPLSDDDPHVHELSSLKPVLELKSTIVKVVNLEPGDRVSYNGTFTAKKPMRIGVLPLGYYEGVPRVLSNVGVVTHGNDELPILGRVCMNHTMVGLDDSSLGVGDEVTVISADPAKPNSVARMVAIHQLFGYGILTGLSSSVRRVITFV
jgi:alanine racemase